jgi:hypothetical protein
MYTHKGYIFFQKKKKKKKKKKKIKYFPFHLSLFNIKKKKEYSYITLIYAP